MRFDDEIHAKIPVPKATWVRKVVEDKLREMDHRSLVETDFVFCFVIGGKFVQAKGKNKPEALMSLGYTKEQVYSGVAQKHGTPEEAQAQGWYEKQADNG